MNSFEKLLIDVFSNTDFLEKCYINGEVYDCIVTNIENGVTFSETGYVDEENFTLDIKLPLKSSIKVNDQVKFKDKLYKISNIVNDSAFKSIKIYLIALSKGIGA